MFKDEWLTHNRRRTMLSTKSLWTNADMQKNYKHYILHRRHKNVVKINTNKKLLVIDK